MRHGAEIIVGVLLACGQAAAQGCPQDQPQGVNRPIPAPQNNKVCEYDRPVVPSQPAYWWQLLYELFKWKPAAQLPFRRSVAFLAGVSRYSRISPQLDFVATDLTEMRNFLLSDGGFDTVYEVRDGNVSHQVIEDFMGKYFSDPGGPVKPADRLLFYYSGHGGAQAEVEPYLLFQNANPPYDYSDGVPVRDVYRWARTIRAKHLLIILDSCFSGLAREKPGPDEPAIALSNALAGEPSGLLLTAGTDDERAYAIRYSNNKDGSVFTHALIGALRSMSKTDGIVTIGQAFEQAKVTVGGFDAVANKKMNPLPTILPRKDGLGKGNFIFINPKAQNPALPPGLDGQAAAIAKAPDSVDPYLSILQKEYDAVNNSSNLTALRVFVATYRGKSYGQVLVSLVEERIAHLEGAAGAPPVQTPPPPQVTAQTSPRDLRSDLLHLVALAQSKQIPGLRLAKHPGGDYSEGFSDHFDSSFVVTDASSCEVSMMGPNAGGDIYPYDVHCTFSASRYTVSRLLDIAKAALPELVWGRLTDDTTDEGVSGTGTGVWVRIVRYKGISPHLVHLYVNQKGK